MEVSGNPFRILSANVEFSQQHRNSSKKATSEESLLWPLYTRRTALSVPCNGAQPKQHHSWSPNPAAYWV